MKKLIKKILLSPYIAKKITKILLRIHRISYAYLGSFASASENGIHPKHRLTNYHKFFVDNISENDAVLDVGCGNGLLLKDIAVKTKAVVVGVDISENNVKTAKKELSTLPNVEIIHSDIWEYNEKRTFDSITLSNVLEHLDRRVELLRRLNEQFKPKQFLIRVPMFEREWVVPYKKELGIDYRLDATHKIEYTEGEFRDELAKAGLMIKSIALKWGEIYAVVVSGNE